MDECNYNAKSDIWALGCLVYELCSLEPPFQAKTQIALSAKIKQGRVQSIPCIYSRELDEIIKAMLITSYNRRPGTVELLTCDPIKSRIIRLAQSLKSPLSSFVLFFDFHIQVCDLVLQRHNHPVHKL